MRRSITLISLHFPPSAASGAFRMLGFARYLPAFGWTTSVISCTAVPGEPVDRALLADVPSGTPVRYVDYPRSPLAEIGRRLLNLTDVIDRHAVWSVAARRACDEWITREQPDVILTSGPTHAVHLLGLWLRRRHGVRLVTDFRDNWTDPDHPLNFAASLRRKLERRTLQRADGIVANAPRALEAMARICDGAADRMVVVPNGFDPYPPDAEGIQPDVDGPLTILHAGELYAGRNPLALLTAMAGAEKSAVQPVPWQLRFMGRIANPRLDPVAEAASRGLRSRVSVDGQLAYGVAKSEMRRADILLLLDGPGRRVGVPAKVYEYIGANRPILALAEPDGDTAWALEAGGARYRIARPTDTAAIQQALIEISAIARAAPPRTPTPVDSPFTRQNLAGKLAAFLDELVTKPKRSAGQ